MARNRPNFFGHKACTKCKNVLPCTLEYFYKARHYHGGLSSECRGCKKARMVPINRRAYSIHRESRLIASYIQTDIKAGRVTDLTPKWLADHITSRPCTYCGTVDHPRGCDRLDNTIGHVVGNVVPCCKLCNKTRNDHFTYEEMRLLGQTIMVIRQARL